MARKKDFMKFEFLKDLSGKTPEEIAANGRFTVEEAKVISGAKVAVEQALELLKKKELDEDVINVSKDILVGNVSVETVATEIPFGVVTTKLPFGTLYVGPTTFEGQPGLMEEVVIKNIATGEETVVSQVVVKAPVPAQTIAMDEDPSKNDLVGNQPPFNHQSPFAHPSRPNFPGAYFANNSQDHLRPKANFHPHQDDSQAKVDFMKGDHSDDKHLEDQGVTIEDILEAIGNGREIRFVPMHEELPGHPPKFSPEQLRSMSIARELDRENEQSQGFEAFKNFLGLQ